MNCYEKNIEFLREKDSNLIEKLENWLEENEKKGSEIVFEEGKFGYPVVIYRKDGKEKYLSSPYDGDGIYEDMWMESVDEADYESIIFWFGMSRLNYAKQIHDKHEKMFQVIYEPSVRVFYEMLKNTDITFFDEMVIIVVNGLNEDQWYLYASNLIEVSKISSNRYFICPGYEEVFSEEYKDYKKILKKAAELQIVTQNTRVAFVNDIIKNQRNNLKVIAKGKDLAYLMEKIPEGKPGIVVSAGPSLNKNIDELKNAKGKAVIVATDSATKVLINHGIMPDFFYTLDPAKPMVLFEKEEICELPMICHEFCNSDIFKKRTGKNFFSLGAGSVTNDFYIKYDKKRVLFNSGGSVATDAFSFLKESGCNPIILIGQDLAMTNNKSHADGTFQDKMPDYDKNEGQFFEVDGIDGKPVITRGDFKLYLDWFEKEIEESEDITVVDATEGGALIHGSKIMTLKDAIEEYCVEEIDIQTIIDEAPNVFSDEEIDEIYDDILHFPNLLEELKKKLKRGIIQYEDLIFRAKKNDYGKTFKSAFQRTIKLNSYLEENMAMKIIRSFLIREDIVQKNKLKEMDVNSQEGLLEMLTSGKEYLEMLLKKIDQVKPDFEETSKEIEELQNKN